MPLIAARKRTSRDLRVGPDSCGPAKLCDHFVREHHRQRQADRLRRSDIKFLRALATSTLRKCNESVPPANLDGARDSVRWCRLARLPISWLYFNCKWQFGVGAAKSCSSLRKVKNVDPRCGRGQQPSRDHQITGELEGGCAPAPRRHRSP